MNTVFFGNEGLTSTSGAYYCNIAQEIIQSKIEKLNNVKFYEVTIASIGSQTFQLMSKGVTSLSFINKFLQEIAEMNSFCAWVREAIKEKDNALSEIASKDIEDWAIENNIKLPVAPDPVTKIRSIDESYIINTWDADKRNKYFKLEAFASTYGKYIHPNGALSNAKKEAYIAEANPCYKEGSGRDTVIYNQSLTVSLNGIESKFMELQSIYRSYEKELNSMKAELKTETNKKNIAIEEENKERIANFDAEYSKYSSSMSAVRSEFNSWKTKERERISNLKIVLPKDLIDTFNKIKEQETY